MISYRLRHHNLITRAKLPEFRFQVKKLIVTCIAMQPQENLYCLAAFGFRKHASFSGYGDNFIKSLARQLSAMDYCRFHSEFERISLVLL